MSTQEIYNYRKVNDQLITGGQPTEEQLKSVAEEGFTTVINLATLNPRYSLDDEAGLVQSLGLTYYHIPVEWDNPQASDFETFERLMKQLPGRQDAHSLCSELSRDGFLFTLCAKKSRLVRSAGGGVSGFDLAWQ